NSGDNMLIGREGSDTLRGNGGADTFVFDRKAGPDNVDTIVDFTSGEDIIKLRGREFGVSDRGVLATDALHLGVAADSTEDRVIYDIENGRLWVDRDGSGGGEKELIAILQNQALIDATDFEFY
ncbi:MAG: M10 family metallopeptidase C-terminal domain-containing protein, partial [Pseudomonadota bacterium]